MLHIETDNLSVKFVQNTSTKNKSGSLSLPRGVGSELGDRCPGLPDRKYSLGSIRRPTIPPDRKESDCSIVFDVEYDTSDDTKWKGMVKQHYVPTGGRTKCLGCAKKFSLKKRPHHCRRCGDVFCIKCLQYKMTLNELAHPDPAGKKRKVCRTCANDVIIDVTTRPLTEYFNTERQLCKHERVIRQRVNSLTNTFWRDKLDIPKECKRLLRGYEATVGTSGSSISLHTIQGLIQTPDWQQPLAWKAEKESENCRSCKSALGVLRSNKNCKICGLSLCKKCSHKELLLYYDNDEPSATRRPKLAVINVIGCPVSEPNVSLLLHVCSECKTYISKHQAGKQSWWNDITCSNGHVGSHVIEELVWMDDIFSQLQISIITAITQCQLAIDSEEINHNKLNVLQSEITKPLMKLGALMDEYEQQFKKLKPFLTRCDSNTHKTFIKNYIKSKYDFFMENRHTYRQLNKHRPGNKSNTL